MMRRSSLSLVAVTTAMLLGTAAPAVAGPPLICHPFQTGGTASLPWGTGPGWNTPDSNYDVRRLPADVTRLLAAEKAVIPRMETLRRATIYAARDPRVAYELLAHVLGRALGAAAVGKPDDLAWFDAGYLVESYKQATHIYRWDMLDAGARAGWTLRDQLQGLDGYAWVRRALELSNGNPDMEFAATLMKSGAISDQHRRNAAARARPGSLLARALSSTGN
jgi:hypothetical protein